MLSSQWFNDNTGLKLTVIKTNSNRQCHGTGLAKMYDNPLIINVIATPTNSDSTLNINGWDCLLAQTCIVE